MRWRAKRALDNTGTPDRAGIRRSTWRRDNGSLSIELSILLPGFIAMALLATLLGREALAQSAIDLAAHDAARAATVSRDLATGQAAATLAAGDTLQLSSANCTFLSAVITSPPNPYAVPIGQPSTVTVTVKCDVAVADLAALPGLPGHVTLTGVFTSPLDQYRYRTP